MGDNEALGIITLTKADLTMLESLAVRADYVDFDPAAYDDNDEPDVV